jgi:parvulin-like peptidyl-prolyl isomerase
VEFTGAPNRSSRKRHFYVPFVLYVLFALPALAEDDASKPVAKVAGEPILIAEVEREIAIAYGDQPIAASAKDELRAKALEQVIKRRLVLRWLTETKQAAQPDEIERAVRQLQEQLTDRGRSLTEYLKEQKLDEVGWRRAIAWQIGWQRYIDKQLTDKNLEKYFEQHRRDFDGTRIRVAQIFFKVEKWDDKSAVAEVRRRAEQVLAQMRDGKKTFAESARKHSESPSRDRDGDIGFIGRHEPMPESFSHAAFALEPQKTSDLVATTLGIHLIHCLEIKPGDKAWHDVKPELEAAVVAHLFDWASEQARQRVDVEYGEGFRRQAAGTDRQATSSK